MKSAYVALALSLAGAAFATPAVEATTYPYSIGYISLKHLIESDIWDMTWSVTSRDKTDAATGSTTCHTAWNNGSIPVGPKTPEPCANAAYHYRFPTGAYDVESYELVIEGPGGSATTKIEAGYKYQCGPYSGTLTNIDKECKTINGGEFYLNQ